MTKVNGVSYIQQNSAGFCKQHIPTTITGSGLCEVLVDHAYLDSTYVVGDVFSKRYESEDIR